MLQTPDAGYRIAHLREMCGKDSTIRYYVTDEVFAFCPRQSEFTEENNGIQSDKYRKLKKYVDESRYTYTLG